MPVPQSDSFVSDSSPTAPPGEKQTRFCIIPANRMSGKEMEEVHTEAVRVEVGDGVRVEDQSPQRAQAREAAHGPQHVL